jgi:hypothetical protein
MSKSIDEMLVPGNKIRRFYRAGNVNNCTMHIRAIVDGEYIVYRVWSKTKQRWRYGVEWRYAFEMWYENGALTHAGKSKDNPGASVP